MTEQPDLQQQLGELALDLRQDIVRADHHLPGTVSAEWMALVDAADPDGSLRAALSDQPEPVADQREAALFPLDALIGDLEGVQAEQGGEGRVYIEVVLKKLADVRSALSDQPVAEQQQRFKGVIKATSHQVLDGGERPEIRLRFATEADRDAALEAIQVEAA